MSDIIELHAEPRSDQGKGASRRLRKTGLVPAIIYGGDSEPTSISLTQHEFMHNLENETIYTQVLALKVGKKTEKVILRDLQRHPYKKFVLHADFLRIDKNKALNVTVPIHFNNEEQCHGVKMQGGLLTHLANEVEILALPKNLPEYLELDVASLELDDILHLSDIICPEGVEIVALTHGEEHDVGVASVHMPRAASTDETAEESAAEGEQPSGESEESSD